jgi:hypothetical protein
MSDDDDPLAIEPLISRDEDPYADPEVTYDYPKGEVQPSHSENGHNSPMDSCVPPFSHDTILPPPDKVQTALRNANQSGTATAPESMRLHLASLLGRVCLATPFTPLSFAILVRVYSWKRSTTSSTPITSSTFVIFVGVFSPCSI